MWPVLSSPGPTFLKEFTQVKQGKIPDKYQIRRWGGEGVGVTPFTR